MFGKIFTKLSTYFLGELVSKFGNRFKNFSKILIYVNINEDTTTYISNSLFASFLLFLFLEFGTILMMVRLNILFGLFPFLITIILSFTFASFVFILFCKFPYYLLESKRKEIDFEVENSIRHLSVLDDKSLTINDVLNILLKLENNKLLSEEAKKILTLSKINSNIKDTLSQVIKETYSELEKNFFRRLIDVIDNKDQINKVVNEFLESLEQLRKEASEQKKSSINLLFEVNIFLFFFVIILLISLFLISLDQQTIRSLLMFIAIVFPIIEFVLVVILFKG
jgi:hypothetical protein